MNWICSCSRTTQNAVLRRWCLNFSQNRPLLRRTSCFWFNLKLSVLITMENLHRILTCCLIIIFHIHPSKSNELMTEPARVFKRNTGEIAKEGEWPWHCYIKNVDYSDCSGVLIAEDIVITAAHCVVNSIGSALTPNTLTVFAGIVNTLQHPSSRPLTVVRVQAHQNFSITTLDYDIAILWLSEKIEVSNITKPIEVSQQVPIDGTTCYSTGFGETAVARESTLLRKALVPIVSKERCAPLVNRIGATKLTRSMTCAGSVRGGLDACAGDSGGPLVCRKASGGYELVGVTSWGNNTDCGQPSYAPGVYTSLPDVLDWLSGKFHGKQIVVVPGKLQLAVLCDGVSDGGGWLTVERRRTFITFRKTSRLACRSTFANYNEDFCIAPKPLELLTKNMSLEIMMDIQLCDGFAYRLMSNYSSYKNLEDFLYLLYTNTFNDLSDIFLYDDWTMTVIKFPDYVKGDPDQEESVGCDIPVPSNFVWYSRDKFFTRTTIWMLEVKIRPATSLPDAANRTSLFPYDTDLKQAGLPIDLPDSDTAESEAKGCDDLTSLIINSSVTVTINNSNSQNLSAFVLPKQLQLSCDMVTSGGGWTIVQRRFLGDTDFARNWSEYASGFGNGSRGEDFWIGNRLLNQLTNRPGETELLVELQFCDNTNLTKLYRNFVVGDENSQFQLISIKEDGPHAVPAKVFGQSAPFLASEDVNGHHCVTEIGGGGWWYRSCATMLNINGKWGCGVEFPKCNFFMDHVSNTKRRLHIKASRLMIRTRKEDGIQRLFRDLPEPNIFDAPSHSSNYLNQRRHCYDLWKNYHTNATGVYRHIQLDVGTQSDIETDLYCDMTDPINGPGWTVIMRRTDGVESFKRDWIDYADGFGNLEKDFWLGNRLLHRLTYSESWDLQVDITLCNGTTVSRRYHRFNVEDELRRFYLTLDLPNGKDEIWGWGGRRFYAANLANSPPNCANKHSGGGWWWSDENCTNANINGPFGCDAYCPHCMYWKLPGTNSDEVMKNVVMKIRPTDRPLQFGEGPSQHHVFVQGNDNCSGALIAPDIVLTSAHCVANSTRNVTVFSGVYDRLQTETEYTQKRSVKKVIIHNDYKRGNTTSDIAIMWLTNPLYGNTRPVEIGYPSSAPLYCTTVMYSNPIRYNGATSLRIISQSSIVPDDKTPDPAWRQCGDRFVCAIDYDREIYDCPGDSGAPLLCLNKFGNRFNQQWFLYGLMVWGSNYTVCGEPSPTPMLYTNISTLSEWIINATSSTNFL